MVHPKKKTRAQIKLEKEKIIKGGLKVAERIPLNKITAIIIARKIKCSERHVCKYFKTVGNLRKQILLHAIKDGALKIIAQGIVLGYKEAYNLPIEIKQAAFNLFL